MSEQPPPPPTPLPQRAPGRVLHWQLRLHVDHGPTQGAMVTVNRGSVQLGVVHVANQPGCVKNSERAIETVFSHVGTIDRGR
jgi:hypothetical protein